MEITSGKDVQQPIILQSLRHIPSVEHGIKAMVASFAVKNAYCHSLIPRIFNMTFIGISTALALC
ncbi:hypothetical protein RO3G_08563 [Rhizopus delemar RA 99-880]|uniref:Uncharacterized protein n=1 Tax=Rhizopus delemar (strain RA 99-880 / ATCC MYA-4621 / FGSC 9543 / NRRL 43880) TaxID=246409 RepID=I1C5X8_RHIO9|nr:hypothetical protein RO3G_08563 [Rhizopus delemar RA 99-880]|eukprot:EIE83858.1 hypothetical protein RO3G_08563 [Rhizopus delemar RA 99-880]